LVNNERISPIKEAEIILFTEKGKTRQEIANKLHLSKRTIFKYQKEHCLL
jgi:DNA-binding CsgD family transcriptional regulator